MKPTLVLLVALGFPAAALLAQDAQNDAPKDGAVKPTMLDRNVRLDFELVPADADDQNVFVVTALSRFKIGVEFKGPGGAIEFETSGEILLRDDGRISVVHNTRVTFEGEQERGHFHVSSGILLRPGESLEVSRMGEKTLVIRASYVEEEKP